MITAEEQKSIQDAESIYRMAHGGGWALLCQYMDCLVEEARATYENDLDSDPMVSHSLKIRVQQRKSVVQGIKDFVQETLEFRLSLLSDPQGEQNGDNTDAGYYPIGGVPKTASGNGSSTYTYPYSNGSASGGSSYINIFRTRVGKPAKAGRWNLFHKIKNWRRVQRQGRGHSADPGKE